MKRIAWPNIFLLTVLVLLTYIPFLFVVANSVKSDAQIAANPLNVLWTFHIQNYITAWNGMDQYLLNTVIVAIISVAVAIPIAASAG